MSRLADDVDRVISHLEHPAIDAERYHADDVGADRPTLSASIATILCNRSPAHAWQAHPKLNPDWQPTHDTKFDIGHTAHALLLEQRDLADVVVVCDYPDWRTNAAKDERDQARAAGKVPLLTDQAAAVLAMVKAVSAQLADFPVAPRALTDGKAEQTIVWDDDGVACRALIDWLRDDNLLIEDVKTCRNADPERWGRTLFDYGYDVQCAMHSRGVQAVTGVRPEWRWILIEKEPPYAVSVVAPGADVLAIGEAKVEWALRRWAECLRTGSWPGYPREVHEAEAPPWADDAKWLVDEYRSAA